MTVAALRVQHRPAPLLHGEARIRLDGRWPGNGTSLRGAVVAALFPEGERSGEHVDWHQHAGPEGTRQTPAPILYRVHGGTPYVYAWGEYAHEHLTHLARHLSALRTAEGEVVGVEGVDLRLERTPCTVRKDRWQRYELRTPYIPGAVMLARQPRARWAVEAWAGLALADSIRLVIGEHPRPVHVSVEGLRVQRVTWRGQERVTGLRGVVVTNAVIPDGIGLGQHRSEGFGEIRRMEAR